MKLAEEFIETHCKKMETDKVEGEAQAASGSSCEIQKMMTEATKIENIKTRIAHAESKITNLCSGSTEITASFLVVVLLLVLQRFLK